MSILNGVWSDSSAQTLCESINVFPAANGVVKFIDACMEQSPDRVVVMPESIYTQPDSAWIKFCVDNPARVYSTFKGEQFAFYRIIGRTVNNEPMLHFGGTLSGFTDRIKKNGHLYSNGSLAPRQTGPEHITAHTSSDSGKSVKSARVQRTTAYQINRVTIDGVQNLWLESPSGEIFTAKITGDILTVKLSSLKVLAGGILAESYHDVKPVITGIKYEIGGMEIIVLPGNPDELFSRVMRQLMTKLTGIKLAKAIIDAQKIIAENGGVELTAVNLREIPESVLA